MYYYQRLKDIREDNDKTQDEIAEILKLKQQQYQRYETGRQELPMHHFITLALYYKISLDYIVGLTNTPRTIDGKPYSIKNMTQINGNNNKVTNIKGNNNKINIKNS